MTPYQALGGEPTFVRLVEAFYSGVEDDPLLSPMYPEDLEPSKRHLTLFLVQRFGGPTTYSNERGHPRLRARHVGFAIDPSARDAWLRHMGAAITTLGLPEAANAELLQYFQGAADFLINR